MQTVRDIIEIAVKYCAKDVEKADAYYVDKTVAKILSLEAIEPHKNKRAF